MPRASPRSAFGELGANLGWLTDRRERPARPAPSPRGGGAALRFPPTWEDARAADLPHGDALAHTTLGLARVLSARLVR
jgi:hypothetical protein